MAPTDQEIRDIVAYSQRPIVTEQPLSTASIEFLLIVCGSNKSLYLEVKRQLQLNHFRDDELLLKLLWMVIDASWSQYYGVTYETLAALLQQELNGSTIPLTQQQYQMLFVQSSSGLLFTVASPGIDVTGANAELARDILRRFVIDRGIYSPVRRIMQSAGTANVPASLSDILKGASRLYAQASSVSELPRVDMAPEFGTAMPTQAALTPLGVSFMDAAIGGHRPGEVIGLLGPTGGGKTTLGVHLAVSHAKWCWAQAIAESTPSKFVIYVTAEESAELLRPRIWSAFFQIQRDRAAAADPFTNMTTQENLLAYEREAQRGQPVVLSERERYMLYRPVLQSCFDVLDLSGSSAFPHAGTGYIDEIETHINRLIEMRNDQQVSLIVIDYAGLVVQRHIEFRGMEDTSRTALLKYFGQNCRRQLAERFGCSVWVLHQMSGQSGGSSPTRLLSHVDAADSKNFAENMVACGCLGVGDPVTGCRRLNWSKTRNKANETIMPATLKIHKDFAMMIDVSSQYAISDSGAGFMDAASAASVGAIDSLTRRDAVVHQPGSMPDDAAAIPDLI